MDIECCCDFVKLRSYGITQYMFVSRVVGCRKDEGSVLYSESSAVIFTFLSNFNIVESGYILHWMCVDAIYAPTHSISPSVSLTPSTSSIASSSRTSSPSPSGSPSRLSDHSAISPSLPPQQQQPQPQQGRSHRSNREYSSSCGTVCVFGMSVSIAIVVVGTVLTVCIRWRNIQHLLPSRERTSSINHSEEMSNVVVPPNIPLLPSPHPLVATAMAISQLVSHNIMFLEAHPINDIDESDSDDHANQ
eukprot:c23180_g1_i1.p1 GENE.c23180_g1_i1~~c23180_g1_i1.p1  ORF type:complete len:287 (+),score=78.07 c23180_g1_i1:123-863(+)